MERGDRRDEPWDGDHDDHDEPAAAYPPAPVPAHERAWRHPSELGHANWTLSEPPLVIGRGLLVATGVFGTLLGVAVLWMLVPIGFDAPHRGSAAAPGVTRSDDVSSEPGTGTLPVAALGSGASTPDPAITLPAEQVPPNTLLLTSGDPEPARGSTPAGLPTARTAVVVMVEGSSLLLTTAAAVTAGDVVADEVTVADSDDDPQVATVVSVAGGVAMLAPADSSAAGLDVVGFSQVASVDAGDTVTLLGVDPVELTYPGEGEALDIDPSAIDPTTIAEGTPVVDGEGALVALCTMSTDSNGEVEVHVVPVAPLVDDATSTITVPPAPTDRSAWLGVQLVAGELGGRGVRIAAVLPDSPAIAAELRTGELILSIDDRAVASLDDVLTVMATASPGDTVLLVVAELGADGSITTTRVVSVVLAAAVPSV